MHLSRTNRLNMESHDECPIEGGYVIMPRYIAKDGRNGLLTNPERNLLMWVRLQADMTGVSHCSMQGLADEAFNDKMTTSYINKLLRSLKSKKYLWYQDRNGRRGSFEVHLPDWLLKNGNVKEIDYLFEQESVETKAKVNDKPKPEPNTVSDKDSQSIEERKKAIRTMLSKIPKQT